MTQTDDARGPDWEGFGRDLLESWPVRDVDGSELFDAALRNGLIAEIPGGYDPDQHIDAEGICPEAGDPWYEYAFHPARVDLPPTDAEVLAHPKVRALVEKAQAALDLNDNTSPFGGEIQRDRIERTVDEFRAALAAIQEAKP